MFPIQTSATASIAPSVATTAVSGGDGGTPVVPVQLKAPNTVSRKRSFSENWLAHKPAGNVVSRDILQPVMKKKKTVTNPKQKHLRSNTVKKYCLEHQEEDSEGDVKTALFKVFKVLVASGSCRSTCCNFDVLIHLKDRVKI